MTSSKRKVGFIGFLTCINSVLKLYKHLVEEKSLLKYLPTIKVSQDHLELFFGAIRSHGGCNDKPTARQFAAAFKRLIVVNEVRDVTSGNCLPLEHIKILHVSSLVEQDSLDIINWSSARRSLVEESEGTSMDRDDDITLDHDYLPDPRFVSELSERIIAYIARFVARHLQKRLHCADCIDALTTTAPTDPIYSLIRHKTLGGLLYPSGDDVRISRESEKALRSTLAHSSTSSKNFLAKLLSNVLKSFIGKDMFSTLNEHMLDNDPMESHAFHLMRCTAQKYPDIRLHSISRTSTQSLHPQKSRQRRTKLTQFQGQ